MLSDLNAYPLADKLRGKLPLGRIHKLDVEFRGYAAAEPKLGAVTYALLERHALADDILLGNSRLVIIRK